MLKDAELRPILGRWDSSDNNSTINTGSNFEYWNFIEDNCSNAMVFVHSITTIQYYLLMIYLI